MSTPSQLTTTPNPKFAGLHSTQDYYERFRNPNLFISNNANPFLISPYSPNQLSKTTANAILAANTIKPLTPGGTIQIDGNVTIAAPTRVLFEVAGTRNVLFESASASFETPVAPGAYSLFVDGTISTAAIAVTTAAGAAPGGAPVASLPITVGGVAYNLALY